MVNYLSIISYIYSVISQPKNKNSVDWKALYELEILNIKLTTVNKESEWRFSVKIIQVHTKIKGIKKSQS